MSYNDYEKGYIDGVKDFLLYELSFEEVENNGKCIRYFSVNKSDAYDEELEKAYQDGYKEGYEKGMNINPSYTFKASDDYTDY